VASLALASGCFDEGSTTVQTTAALTTAQGLIAFADIHNNIESDPAAAGEALLEFMKWPVAADNLVSPPFDLSIMDTAQRSESNAAPVPECLLITGKAGCDHFQVVDECEAGGFSFNGSASRRCSPCDMVEGTCRYGFQFPQLTYTSTLFTLQLSTAGSWIGTASAVTPNLSAHYLLNLHGAAAARQGTLGACACSTFTVQRAMTDNGKPRKLVNSSFVVQATLVGDEPRCALVEFDSNGDVSVENSCTCKTGAACEFPEVPSSMCGNGRCEIGESFTTCAADCANTANPFCGNQKCEAGETFANCPVDCPKEAAVCGNGICEIGESVYGNDPCVDCFVCGDNVCSDNENNQNCAADCPL
jgi:hypothetical protein